MASSNNNTESQPISSLSQVRMRFQQRNQMELEQRRRELTTTIKNRNVDTPLPSNWKPPTAPSAAAANRNGKVRQMFDDRRRGAGIDRSNLLKPITTEQSTVPTTKTRPRTPTTTFGQTTATKPEPRTTLRVAAGGGGAGGRVTAAAVPLPQLTKDMGAINLNEKQRQSSDSNNNNKYNVNGTVNKNKLKPIVTKKSPPERSTINNNNNINNSKTNSPKTPSPTTTAATPTRMRGGDEIDVSGPPKPAPVVKSTAPPTKRQVNVKSPKLKSPQMINSPSSSGVGPPPEGTEKCRFCGRNFNKERIRKHETVCQRMASTKRKIFDTAKQRLKGTDAEKIGKRRGGGNARAPMPYSSAAQIMSLNTGVKKNNWRKKHEEFIATIRAAKSVQAHLARGGKLSDLPPPPPSENPDYIQCPHCGRRFNQQAAERHIPRCATMEHNKPRREAPGGPASKRR